MESSTLKSFISYSEDHPFPIQNIPFGCFQRKDGRIHCCTRIGDKIIDLALLQTHFSGPLFSGLKENVFAHHHLNKFMALGKDYRIEARHSIQKLFAEGASPVEADAILDVDECTLVMPIFIGDYTDFYSSKNHAYNVGVMFRGPENAL
jgi:fumarylacetoacetase